MLYMVILQLVLMLTIMLAMNINYDFCLFMATHKDIYGSNIIKGVIGYFMSTKKARRGLLAVCVLGLALSVSCATSDAPTMPRADAEFMAELENVYRDLEDYLQLALDKYDNNQITYTEAIMYRNDERALKERVQYCLNTNDLACVRAVQAQVSESIHKLEIK